MLQALATPGSAFKPSIRKCKSTWRLQKFKQLYIEKGGYYSGSSGSDMSSYNISSNSSVVTANSSNM
ncbi:hypothetical protein SBY92_001229 [Candida maltosa Xu316]